MNIFKKIFWILKQKLNHNRISFKLYIKAPFNIKINSFCKIFRYCELDASKNGKIILENGVTLNPYSFLQADNGGFIHIKKGTEINNFTIINSGGKIIIGEDVLIGPKVNIISYSHNFTDNKISIKKQGCSIKPIIIENNVWIGANCTILAGVKIGTGAIIGANSLVNKNVLPNTVNAGSPCVQLKKRK